VQQTIRITDFDSLRLEGLIEGRRPQDPRDARNVEILERHLDAAQVVPADRIGPNVVTMNSEVRVRDLDAQEAMTFRIVYPSAANAEARKISVLAPLGMAVLGREVGEAIDWDTPGGLRRLRVDRILYQPEREGRDFTRTGPSDGGDPARTGEERAS
jgi:regulator of nucleoside diphosphate kinase